MRRGEIRLRWDEECIVPGCEKEWGGAKPIYIRTTENGKRTWKKIGALCEKHLRPLIVFEDTVVSLKETSTGDPNYSYLLKEASLATLKETLERMQEEVRHGFHHKTRIEMVRARIRSLEK